MAEISICTPSRTEQGKAPRTSRKPFALIDPPRSDVLIDERVAQIRNLRDSRNQVLDSRVSYWVTMPEGHQNAGGKYLQRRSKVSEDERQIAELSITHEGDTAFAVCLAVNQAEPLLGGTFRRSTVDDGTSDPMHEPIWGDEGWITEESLVAIRDRFDNESVSSGDET